VARRKRKNLTVVFDGRRTGRPKVQAFGNVTVVFAAPRSADEEIIRRIREARDPRGVTVVTDDRMLASEVASAGARTAGIGSSRAKPRRASPRLPRGAPRSRPGARPRRLGAVVQRPEEPDHLMLLAD